MQQQEKYMRRCLELAVKGAGYTAPNPMVGAVLVHEDRIIGEGYHKKYGEAHAEVNCIASVKEEDKKLIQLSTLYVSLEPCAHYGKTPPCTDLIIKEKIQHVVIGCRDPFSEVDGKGIEKLMDAGVKTETGILESECKDLNKRFFAFHTQHRPYIILKWAQTADAKIAGSLNRLFISNDYSNRLVHKWRSEEASILIGRRTALIDDPELTNRLWHGPTPIRLVVDMLLQLPGSLKIFRSDHLTIVFNTIKHSEDEQWKNAPYFDNRDIKETLYYQVTSDVNLVHQVVNALYQLKIQSVIVEGGARLLQSFIEEDLWDEARVITNTEMTSDGGLAAPLLKNHQLKFREELMNDSISVFMHQHK